MRASGRGRAGSVERHREAPSVGPGERVVHAEFGEHSDHRLPYQLACLLVRVAQDAREALETLLRIASREGIKRSFEVAVLAGRRERKTSPRRQSLRDEVAVYRCDCFERSLCISALEQQAREGAGRIGSTGLEL